MKIYDERFLRLRNGKYLKGLKANGEKKDILRVTDGDKIEFSEAPLVGGSELQTATQVDQKILTEKLRAEAAELSLSQAILSEEARAMAVEAQLSSEISAVDLKIDEEIEARELTDERVEAAELAIQSLQSEVDLVESAIASETQRALSAELALGLRIDGVETMVDQLESDLAAIDQAVDVIESTYATKAYVEATFIPLSQKGAAFGVATLNEAGLIPESQLPSYVDDVLEFPSFESLPLTGEAGKIYVTIDTSKTYRWSGTVYVQITSGSVDTVFGRNGVVTAQYGDYSASQISYGTESNVGAKLDSLQIEIDAAELAIESESIARAGIASEIHSRISLVEAEISRFEKDLKVIDAGMLAQGYVDLSFRAIEKSLVSFWEGAGIFEGDQFTLSVVDGKTRVTFSADFKADEGLEVGDKLRFTYHCFVTPTIIP